MFFGKIKMYSIIKPIIFPLGFEPAERIFLDLTYRVKRNTFIVIQMSRSNNLNNSLSFVFVHDFLVFLLFSPRKCGNEGTEEKKRTTFRIIFAWEKAIVDEGETFSKKKRKNPRHRQWGSGTDRVGYSCIIIHAENIKRTVQQWWGLWSGDVTTKVLGKRTWRHIELCRRLIK